MRRNWRAIGRGLAVTTMALALAAPGAAQPVSSLDLSGLVSGLPPAADTGKPAIGPPAVLLDQPELRGCPAALPCGARLRGEVRKNGAVELQVPALHW